MLGIHQPRTLKRRPMIIGSSSTWRLLDGMIARPRSTSDLNYGAKRGIYRTTETALYAHSKGLGLGVVDRQRHLFHGKGVPGRRSFTSSPLVNK